MLRYKIELDVPHLSEERIRELLAREFSPASFSVERIARVGRATNQSSVESSITQLLADGQGWKSREIVEALAAELEPALVQSGLRRLERRGEVRRIRHGTYVLAGRDADLAPPPGEMARNAVIARLDEPRTRMEIQALARLPADTVGRTLAGLVSAGEVVRVVPGQGEGEPYYALPRRTVAAPSRPIFEQDSRLRVLSAMVPGRFHRAADVAHMAIVAAEAVNRLFELLAGQGLVATFRMGPVRYVTLTQAGQACPGRHADDPKAPAADLLRDMGARRAAFLQILATLGTARTVDVTHALADDLFTGPGCSAVQAAQSLAGIGLIEAADPSVRQPAYRLTALGERVVPELDRVQSPPDPVALGLRVGARRLARKRA